MSEPPTPDGPDKVSDEDRAREQRRRRRERLRTAQTVLLIVVVAAAIGFAGTALVLVATRFIDAALVPAALVAALGFILGEIVRLALGEIRSSREETRRRVREGEERARAWRLGLIADTQLLVERELDAMRAHINGLIPPERPRPATFTRIGDLKIGWTIRKELEELATEVYAPENFGTRDQEFLAKLDRTEGQLTGALLYREALAVDSQWPSRLEHEERMFKGYSGYNEPPD